MFVRREVWLADLRHKHLVLQHPLCQSLLELVFGSSSFVSAIVRISDHLASLCVLGFHCRSSANVLHRRIMQVSLQTSKVLSV